MMEEKKQEERGVSRRMAAGTVLAAAAGGMALYFACLGEGARRALEKTRPRASSRPGRLWCLTPN